MNDAFHREDRRDVNPYYVYVLEATASAGRVTVHVGIAKNVHARLQDHMAGRVKQTRGKEVKLLGFNGPYDHGDALRLEKRLKSQNPYFKRRWANPLTQRWGEEK